MDVTPSLGIHVVQSITTLYIFRSKLRELLTTYIYAADQAMLCRQLKLSRWIHIESGLYNEKAIYSSVQVSKALPHHDFNFKYHCLSTATCQVARLLPASHAAIGQRH